VKNKIPSPFFSIEHYALKVRDDTIRDFDNRNKAKLETTLERMRMLLVIKLLALAENGINTQARFQAYSINKQVLDILVSALQMARQRGALEVFTLLRVALEASCSVLQISRDEDAYHQYMLGRYKSTNAITFAKEFVPVVGEVYGALSKAAIHINRVAYGPRQEQDKSDDISETISFDFEIRERRPIQDGLLLSFISLVSLIALKIYEVALFEKDDSLEGWLKLSGTRIKYISRSDAMISEHLEEIKGAPWRA
jgi:hypothetical protein